MSISVAAGLTAIKATLDVAKLTSDLLNKPNIDVSQVREKLHEMLIHAVNAQMALVETLQEIAELQKQLDDKAELASLRDDMAPVADGGFLIKKSENAVGHFIPYCPVCWGEHSKAIALVPMASGYYTCVIHHANYQTTAYRTEQKRVRAETSSRSRPSGPDAWMA